MNLSGFVLVMVDMQRHFELRNPEAFAGGLVANVARALSAARQKGLPIIHVLTEYSPDKADWPEALREEPELWCMRGTEGARPILGLTPVPGEPVVVKTRFSAFFGTDLDRILQRLNTTRVLLCGYSSDVCVRFTAVDAYNRDYLVTVLRDCVRPDKEDPDRSIEYLRGLISASVCVVEDLERAAPPLVPQGG